MECTKCNSGIEGNPKFCPNCGEKQKTIEIKKDVGEQVIAKLEKLSVILESKKKEENEKLYPCPFCNKEITIQQLKSNKLKEAGIHKSHTLNAQ